MVEERCSKVESRATESLAMGIPSNDSHCRLFQAPTQRKDAVYPGKIEFCFAQEDGQRGCLNLPGIFFSS